jgi:branched-chain amino acid:cation transporter, LIVCS family
MSSQKKASPFIIGLALFSMFFGSGNLIFPLIIGRDNAGSSLFASSGFMLTAVVLPFLGVLTMVVYKGNYASFFEILGKRAGFVFALLLLTVWIPLGSGPRCITLAYASFSQYVTLPSLAVFSALYCVAVFFIMYHETKILSILGYILTPFLLVCLAIIIFRGMNSPAEVSELSSQRPFVGGLCAGYNTMDLIASFFFSSSIISMIKAKDSCIHFAVKVVLQASVIGMILLATVYMGLIMLASYHAESLIAVPNDQLLAHLSKLLLGPYAGVVAAGAISLACFTTSVALTVVYANFIRDIFGRYSLQQRHAVIITVGISFGMSILGFEGITAFTTPLLGVLYPALIILIAARVVQKCYSIVKKPLVSSANSSVR